MQTRIQLSIFESDKDKLFDRQQMVEETLDEALAKPVDLPRFVRLLIFQPKTNQ